MKKNYLSIIAILLIIATFIGYQFYYRARQNEKIAKINAEYESLYNLDILGTNLASIINKIDDSNNKNGIEKDNKGLYIENDINSIKIDVKFLELDEVIAFEKIEKQGVNQLVQNFGAMTFRCTKIEYHKKTGNIKYMYFEQVE